MAGSFRSTISRIIDGEDVKAAVANRPLDELADNTRHLKDVIDQLEAGQALILRDASVAASVAVGAPVYYNAATQQFEAALAAVETDTVTRELITAATANVWGVIHRKDAATGTLADIVLKGVVDLDLSLVIDGAVQAGQYFVSGTTAGKLVRSRPPVGVYVLCVGEANADGTYRCRVDPIAREALEAHKHYRYRLECRPAGDVTPPSEGQRHTISNENVETEGWLPAGHSSFAGHAPAGAKFGYNIAASALRHVWPPIPPESAYLEFDRGENKNQMGMGVPLGTDGLAVVDIFGIWWMSDCYGEVPWPTEYAPDAAESISVTADCTRETGMRLTLWFSRPSFQTTLASVLSLRAKAGSGLKLYCVTDGSEQTVGHLEIDFDSGLLLDNTDEPGYVVVKTLENNLFKRGPVVAGLKASGTNVTVTGDETVAGYAVGNLEISVQQSINETELLPSTIRLEGATEEAYQGMMAIGFLASRTCAARSQIYVPATQALPSGTRLKLRLFLLARAAGTIPEAALAITYLRVPTLTENNTPAAAPFTYTALTLDSETTVTAANQYVRLETAAFTVAAGDTVYFTISRAVGDGYAGDLHLFRQVGVLVQED